MRQVLIAGASGMIGNIILNECLQSSEIASVISLVRKPSGFKHQKLIEIVIKDFTDSTEIASSIQHIDIAYFCVGVYTGALPDAEFKKVTVDMAIAFGDAVKTTSPNATFCFLSGAGADLKEKSRLPFARYKGMAENYLLKQAFLSLYIFRPAYIYPVEKRVEPNWSYKLFRAVNPILRHLYPQGEIRSTDLGKAMFQAGLKGSGQHILENVQIKQLKFS